MTELAPSFADGLLISLTREPVGVEFGELQPKATNTTSVSNANNCFIVFDDELIELMVYGTTNLIARKEIIRFVCTSYTES